MANARCWLRELEMGIVSSNDVDDSRFWQRRGECNGDIQDVDIFR